MVKPVVQIICENGKEDHTLVASFYFIKKFLLLYILMY